MARQRSLVEDDRTGTLDALDELDRRLIELLQIDGRPANTEPARRLKVTEGIVRNRITRLLAENLIQVGA
jgi:Lrp/AsnC family transcriptional regulator for asnA, asnC and gidA